MAILKRRPELAALFDGLASFDHERQLKSCATLCEIDLEKGVLDYSLNRLIKGLSSGRGEARYGFSTGLIMLLPRISAKTPLADLWKSVEEKLSLRDKDQASANAIGQYLFLFSVAQSGAYVKDAPFVLTKLLALLPKHSFLHEGIWAAIEKVFSGGAGKQKPSQSTEPFYLVSNCVDSLFKIKVRAGQSASVTVPENAIELLTIFATALAKIKLDVLQSARKQFKDKDTATNDAFYLVWVCIQLWASLTPDEEEKDSYKSAGEELLTIASNFSRDDSHEVLLDWIVGLLSQEHRFHRAPIQYLFAHLLPRFSAATLEQLIETIGRTDVELLAGEQEEMEVDEDDDEFAPIDPSEIPTKGEDDDSDDDDGASVDSDPDAEVDPELVRKLKEALGKHAAVSDDEDNESVLSAGPTDEEMFRLDEGLAAAFSMANGKEDKKKEAKQYSRIAQALRMKLLDLLLVAISSADTPANVKFSLALPLVALIKKLSSREGEDASVRKAYDLIGILTHIKKIDVGKKELTQVLKKFFGETWDTTGAVIKKMVEDMSAWLFILGAKSAESPEKKHKALFTARMTEALKDQTKKLTIETVTGAYNHYPVSFASELPTLVAYGFDEDVAEFKRSEALNCATSLLRKDLAIDGAVATELAAQISKLFQEIISNPKAVSARQFSAVLKFTSKLVPILDGDLKRTLAAGLAQPLDDFLGATDFWAPGGPAKKYNANCQQVNGKSPIAVLKAIQKSLA
ncbi:unnamed protein product, partial [Mesorhabditis spiculigera]